jgi:aryl-alcohol dehydrogenase-like predicted oxidoreductase
MANCAVESIAIPGTSTVAHLEEDVNAALIELTPAQVQQLDAAV